MLILETSQTTGSMNSTVNLAGDISNNTDASYRADYSSASSVGGISVKGQLDDTSDLEIDYSGGEKTDKVTTAFSNRVDGDLQDNVTLGKGNDSYSAIFNDKWAITSSGSAHIEADGGDGNDTITSKNSASATDQNAIVGVWDFTLDGAGGNDNINGDIGSVLMERGGNLCYHANGEDGEDSEGLNLNADQDSTGGNFDVALRGGAGNDFFHLHQRDASGNVTQEPGGASLIVGEQGNDTSNVSGNMKVNQLSVEHHS
jgi:hypothetical protein